MPNVNGTILWYAKAFVDNVGNYATTMKNVYWKYPALTPVMTHIDNKAPKKVKNLMPLVIDNDLVLFWKAPSGKDWKNKAEKYVVYKFDKGEKVNISDPSKIVTITTDEYYKLPEPTNGYSQSVTYVVTALDKAGNESKPKKKTLKY